MLKHAIYMDQLKKEFKKRQLKESLRAEIEQELKKEKVHVEPETKNK